MLRTNGVKRFAKTFTREALGFNRAFRREFARQMELPGFPHMNIRQMDASRLDFPDDSFDLVISDAVFEHLSDPEEALLGIKRVLRPGGGAWLLFRHYGNVNALHDLRVIAGHIPGRWGHLRPSIADTVQQGAFVNTYRIGDWRALFAKHVPQARIELTPLAAPDHEELARARAAGELEGFTDEELLANDVIASWRA